MKCDMKAEEIDILVKAIEAFGTTAQIDMAIEECSELINALCKYRRGRIGMEEVITEIADVQIMTKQLSLMFDEEAVANESDRKLERLASRIEKHNINSK